MPDPAANIDTALHTELVNAAVSQGWHDVAARMGRWAAAGYTGSWQDATYDPPAEPGPLGGLPAFERAARAVHNQRWGADAEDMWGYTEWRDEAHGLAKAAITAWRGDHGCVPVDVHQDALARGDVAHGELDCLAEALAVRGIGPESEAGPEAAVVDTVIQMIDRMETALIEAARELDEEREFAGDARTAEQENRRDGLRAATETLAGRVIDEDSDDRWTIRDLERVTIEMAGRYADWIATGDYDWHTAAVERPASDVETAAIAYVTEPEGSDRVPQYWHELQEAVRQHRRAEAQESAARATLPAEPRPAVPEATPGVGRAHDGDPGRCSYSGIQEGDATCGEPATIHLITDRPSDHPDGGLASLPTCDGHADIARRAARIVAEHPHQGHCGQPATIWDEASNTCAPAPSTVEDHA